MFAVYGSCLVPGSQILASCCFTMKFLFIVFLVLLTSGHSVLCYTDTCDYSYDGQQYLCGNICLDNGDLCECGDQNITRGWSYDEYCCASASSCTNTTTGAKCSEGHVLDRGSPTPCNATGRCFNDVLKSKHLSNHAKYTCQDKCIDPYDMINSGVCEGVSLCPGDQEMCTPQQLRCPRGKYSLHNMSTIPVRSYCYEDYDFRNAIKNNGSYDLMDRSDENVTVSSETRAHSINYTALTPCSYDDWDQGVNCDGLCRLAAVWCDDKIDLYCADSGVNTNNPVLCSNDTFWRNISCDKTYRGQFYAGVRCTGTIQHCRFPQGSPDERLLPTTCRDKSDRTYMVGEPCPDTPGETGSARPILLVIFNCKTVVCAKYTRTVMVPTNTYSIRIHRKLFRRKQFIYIFAQEENNCIQM